jgi:hypothetical protein
MVVLMWFAMNQGGAPLAEGTQRVIDFGLSNQALTIITVGHILIGVLSNSRYLVSIIDAIEFVEPPVSLARVTVATDRDGVVRSW